ncbi:MAG: hypothetical protein OJF49_004032 [Ktedonobacterales bacterium]|jgi:predicted RNase H-like HicB family nuclease/uncharacterized damage-inducible protein DinB|nr:MAG: hypothetical protein OJF49_004032 [Ktedonobacterales bacterium]
MNSQARNGQATVVRRIASGSYMILPGRRGASVMAATQTYALYVESGPRLRTTMVHALDLPGCIAKGPTTEVALAGAPDAIRAYLRFLRRHGEDVEPRAHFTTRVAEHIMDGAWLGAGDPALVFQPDLEAISAEDVETCVRRLEAMRADLLTLVCELPLRQMDAEPSSGRSVRAMLEHLLESEYFYFCSAFGTLPGLSPLGAIVRQGQGDLLNWMASVRVREIEHIRALTAAERTRAVTRWQQTWTARKGLRRMLEHEWEHLNELSNRLGQPL